MADISDITAYLTQQASLALYPNGKPAVGQSTLSAVAGMDVTIFEGWPLPEVLDLDLTGRMMDATGKVVSRPNGPRANVTIFPMRGSNEKLPQILDQTYTIVAPTYGLTLTPVATVGSNFNVTINGTPGATEFLTIELDGFYIASATGATVALILAALATQINAMGKPAGGFYAAYSASIVGNTLTISGAAYCIARLGSTGTLGKATYKERQSVMITAWCPDHVTRNKIASAIDILIKHSLTVTMPDTSMALIVYNRTNVIDELQPVACYRRDLIYSADYATVEQFQGTVITSVSTSITPQDPVTQNFTGTTTAT